MRQKKKVAPRTSRLMGAMAVVSVSLLLSHCMSIVAAGAAASESAEKARDKRWAKREGEELRKLPPEEQALARLWYVQRHGDCVVDGIAPREETVPDGNGQVTRASHAIYTKDKEKALEAYDKHFARFGWQQVTPSANALRSYALNRHRVDIGMVTPSVLCTSSKGFPDPLMYSDLVIRVRAPR